MNQLRTGGCGPAQRLSGNQSPLIFPGLHPGPAAQGTSRKLGKRRGQAFWPFSKLFHSSSSTSAVPGMSQVGGRESQLLEVALTLQLLHEPGGSGQNSKPCSRLLRCTRQARPARTHPSPLFLVPVKVPSQHPGPNPTMSSRRSHPRPKLLWNPALFQDPPSAALPNRLWSLP